MRQVFGDFFVPYIVSGGAICFEGFGVAFDAADVPVGDAGVVADIAPL